MKNNTNTENTQDLVNHPKHYQSRFGIECIEAIGAAVDNLNGFEAVCTGNIIKYMWRWKEKNGIEDLQKAEWYLQKLIGYETPVCQ